ncbi:hypothetical protein GUITHDRAFT_148781 [Guillardia theta CCMP2712]|uniref:Uncharacterized protein n=1 Tax=Guillardia theta (strain CCMP2712) TaxID=905079 RepID=L1I7Y2_GUITC|nr:hypothetical protein GUITHDRAFT_148781 [Guillardia theta CCMP2712]EKX32197.1 hypothetical protein GUITHDRAFT_148781 [Guillardia theta CCMP2712]|eukprot:XP_005819177.1 hypothetical protein GUITHDRAFT_148781 [Guillardia theta CCMP2712]
MEGAVLFGHICLFFILMFSEPFIYNNNLPYCDKYRYISENISVQKGVASVMVFLMYPTWFVLVSIASRFQPGDIISRVPCTILAVVAFSGALNVLMYDQDIASNLSPVDFQHEIDRQHNMHILGALQLCTAFIFGQLLLAFAFSAKDVIDNLRATIWLWICRVLSIVTLVILTLNALLYKYGDCKTTTVWLEYFMYFFIGATNAALYVTYTVFHTIDKMKCVVS